MLRAVLEAAGGRTDRRRRAVGLRFSASLAASGSRTKRMHVGTVGVGLSVLGRTFLLVCYFISTLRFRLTGLYFSKYFDRKSKYLI